MKLIARVPRSNILLLNFSLFNIRSASTESESLSKDSTEPRHSGDSQSDGQLSLDVADNNRYSTVQYSTVQYNWQNNNTHWENWGLLWHVCHNFPYVLT